MGCRNEAVYRGALRYMSNWKIIIAVCRGAEREAQKLHDDLQGSFSAHRQATFKVCAIEKIAPEQIMTIDTAILIVNEDTKAGQVSRFLSECEEAHIPMLAICHGINDVMKVMSHSGAMVQSSNTPIEVTCATLNALLHRQVEIKALKQELALLNRAHGGVHNEMAKIHEELQLAGTVQRDYLPQDFPQLHGVSVAALWRPVNYVAGDIYDVQQLDEDHLGIFLADAVGHGVPAALMTMIICQSLRTHERNGSSWEILPPSEVLSRLNADMVRRQERSSRFATAVYAVVNCRSRTMTIAGAGHPPSLILHADGRKSMLDSQGGLLGVFENEVYKQAEVELDVGDRLLLYSDGFEQAFPQANGDESNTRVPTEVYLDEFEKLCAAGTPQETIDAVSERLDQQSGSLHQIDDLTLICLHAGALVGTCESEGALASTSSHSSKISK